MKKLQVIEPSVVRLTSDETRMLMKAAVSPGGVSMPYNGSGVLDLGLVQKVHAKRKIPSELKQKMLQARAACLTAKTWNQLQKRLEAHSEARRRYNSQEKPQDLFTLTPAGRALVASISIRRR
jgi:hypothetical protein